MKKISFLTGLTVLGLSLSFATLAKLPDLTPEAKEAADLARAKTAHNDKKANYALCLSQNKVAKSYAIKDKVVATPECADPGEFKAPVAAAPAAAPAAAAPAAKPAEVANSATKPAEPAKK
jgi:hypothetical protein